MTTEKDDIAIVHLREGTSKLQHRDWGKGWKNIHLDNWHMRHFVVLVQRNEAVGIASYVDESFAAPGYLGVAAVEIRPDYRNRKLSKQLVQALLTTLRPKGRRFLLQDANVLAQQCSWPRLHRGRARCRRHRTSIVLFQDLLVL